MVNIFALTPEQTMGMSDKMVEQGMFDKPGMMEMKGMPEMSNMSGMDSMSNMKGMPPKGGINDQKASSSMKMKGMEQATTSNMAIMTQKKTVDMEMPPTDEMGKDMQHFQKSMIDDSRNGKQYSSNFGFLASDVSSAQNIAVDGIDSERPWPPYAKLRSMKSTSFSNDKPRRDIRLTLDGDMERYVWFLNKKSLSESDTIRIKEGEIVRFIMINRTMMHHPMHLHGHFFRVINGQGEYSPLKHTVDVAPMSTTVIEFDANEKGDWFFHCHLLYHMKTGMARLIHYQDFKAPADVLKIRQDLFKESWYFSGQAEILSNMIEGFLSIANTRNIFTAEWEAGWQNVDETQWEGSLILERYFNRFFSVFAGVNSDGEDNEIDKTRGVAGVKYLLPLNIESRSWVDTDGGARFMLEKEFELTPRLGVRLETQYDTHENWENSANLGYRLFKNIALTVKWHSNYKWGAGFILNF